MSDLWIPLAPFVLFLVIWICAFSIRRRQRCPDCGQELPVILWPSQKTRRIWLQGGSICKQCGCETDYAGGKVTGAPDASRRVVITGSCLLALAIVGGVMIALLATSRLQPAPAPMAEKESAVIQIGQSSHVD